jgi:hypothetical protein
MVDVVDGIVDLTAQHAVQGNLTPQIAGRSSSNLVTYAIVAVSLDGQYLGLNVAVLVQDSSITSGATQFSLTLVAAVRSGDGNPLTLVMAESRVLFLSRLRNHSVTNLTLNNQRTGSGAGCVNLNGVARGVRQTVLLKVITVLAALQADPVGVTNVLAGSLNGLGVDVSLVVLGVLLAATCALIIVNAILLCVHANQLVVVAQSIDLFGGDSVALRALVGDQTLVGAIRLNAIDLDRVALAVVLVQLVDDNISLVRAIVAGNGELTVLLAGGLYDGLEVENVIVAVTQNNSGLIATFPGALVSKIAAESAAVGRSSQLPNLSGNILNLSGIIAFNSRGSGLAVLTVRDLHNLTISKVSVRNLVIMTGLGEHVLIGDVVEPAVMAEVDLIVAIRRTSRRMVLRGIDLVVLVLAVDVNDIVISSECDRAEGAHYHQNRHNKSKALFETKFHGNFLHRN